MPGPEPYSPSDRGLVSGLTLRSPGRRLLQTDEGERKILDPDVRKGELGVRITLDKETRTLSTR